MKVSVTPSIDSERLNKRIQQLSKIGEREEGGVCRLAFGPEDIHARQLITVWMEEAGMTVKIDAAGNLIGRYPGKKDQLGSLSTGSHIDTVASGGHYDGALGVLAGIEVVKTLQESNIKLDHPIEVIAFTDEENTVIGSKAIAGTYNKDPQTYQLRDNMDIQTCLKKVGGDWSQLEQAKRTATDMQAFVELHVEQGGVLESEGKEIGIVKGIVGQYRFMVTVIGRSNHAGTTPMYLRKDALIAAARIVLTVNHLATTIIGEQVATVGMMNVFPNTTNTVPGQVELSIDLRDLSDDCLTHIISLLEVEFKTIATETHTEITLRRTLDILPTLAHPNIQSVIAQVCQDLQLSYTYLPSRAGHDAQEIGRFTNMGMIFVPSEAGVSHSHDEYTSPEQCVQGANVLLQTLIMLDQFF